MVKLPSVKISTNLLAVLIVLIIGYFYYQVALSTPIVFGDEGYYAGTARWIAKNGISPQSLPMDGSPVTHFTLTTKPFFIVLESFAFLLGVELFVKLMLPLFSMLGALFIYVFLKKLGDPKAGLFAMIAFLLTPSLVTYGVLGYMDTLFVLLIAGALYFGHLSFKENNRLYTVLAGIFIGFAFLTKTSCAALGVFFILYSLYAHRLKNFRQLFVMFLVAGLLMSPLIIRNLAYFGNICFLPGEALSKGCEPVEDVAIENPKGLDFAGRTEQASTEQGLIRFGLLNYIMFAYGLPAVAVFVFGLTFFLVERSEFHRYILISFIAFLLLAEFSLFRAEDTARYMLPLLVPMTIAGGSFLSAFYDRVGSKNRIIALFLIAVIVFTLWTPGKQKIDTMFQVKSFVPGVFDGCDWVKKNTPTDAALLATYTRQVGYSCERRAGAGPGGEVIFLSNNEDSYEAIKKDGFDYVFVVVGLITDAAYAENYPRNFVAYLENDTMHFEKTYDNTAKYGQAGVIIYKVL